MSGLLDTTRIATGEAPVTVLEPLELRIPAIEGRAVMPAGFIGAAKAVGIKDSGRPDLAIIAADDRISIAPLPVAGIFTGNALPAAPVRLSRAHLAQNLPSGEGHFGWTRAIVATSGSANAATGSAGEADQADIAQRLAVALDTEPKYTLALSTGVIGVRLPVDRVSGGIDELASTLVPTDEALAAVAEAICTTDSKIKVATLSVTFPGAGDGGPVRISGIAKGVGMIHPGMATMLSVVLTDAAAEPAVLYEILRSVASRTWNQLSVDGDTSTNDTVFLIASGAADPGPIVSGSAAAAALEAGVEAVARDLARQQAADGEGATTLITCQVSGAASDADARAVARKVVSSSLVKAAVHGRDPNWGRIAAAAGNAGVAIDADRLAIAIAGTLVFDGSAGGPILFDRKAVRQAMDAAELLVRVDLGQGGGTGEAFGCDLTEAYVIENSEYTT